MRSTTVNLEDRTEASRQTRMLSEVVECRGMIIYSPMLQREQITKTLVASLKVGALKETEKYKSWGHSGLQDMQTVILPLRC